MSKKKYSAGVAVALLLYALLAITGCPDESADTGSGQTGRASGTTPANSSSEPGGQSPNLFTGTPMASRAPNNLDLNRNGDRLFVNVVPTSSDPNQYVTMFDIGSDGLTSPVSIAKMRELGKAYLSCHPLDPKCLLVRAAQNSDGRIVDRVLEGELNREPLNFGIDDLKSIPTDGPHDNLLGVKPFYSWDGAEIIVPLTGTGMVIFDVSTRQRVYFPFPEVDFIVTGKAFQALEDQNGKRRIMLSIWSTNEPGDKCRLYTFDLDSKEYSLIAELNWLVYEVGGSDYDNEPWLVAGSRAKMAVTELTRMPLLARLDTSGSNDFQALEFYGEPVWHVELDARGDHVVYADKQRHAMVRLQPATGVLESDPAVYSADEDATILLNNDASRVLLWSKLSLQEANWHNPEDFAGYAE